MKIFQNFYLVVQKTYLDAELNLEIKQGGRYISKFRLTKASDKIHWKDKLQDIWWDVKTPFTHMRWKYRDFTNGISNIFKYAKAVWSDYDFESQSLYDLMYYKLKYQYKFFTSDRTWCVGAKSRAKRIRIAMGLSKRLSEDDYLSNALIPYYDRYPREADLMSNITPEYNEDGRIKFWCMKSDSDEVRHNLFKRCAENSERNKKQDKSLLFDTLNKYIDDWWD